MNIADIRYCIVTALALPDFMTAIAMSCVARDWVNLLAGFQCRHNVTLISGNMIPAKRSGFVLHGVGHLYNTDYVCPYAVTRCRANLTTLVYKYGRLISALVEKRMADHNTLFRRHYIYDNPLFNCIVYNIVANNLQSIEVYRKDHEWRRYTVFNGQVYARDSEIQAIGVRSPVPAEHLRAIEQI